MRLFGQTEPDRRQRFITEQVYQIAPRFSEDGVGIQFDETNADWLLIPRYPLPARWRQRWTSLLIVFGPGYPDAPPTGFFLDVRLALQRGSRDQHLFTKGFHGAADLSEQGWHWYCVLASVEKNGGWKPSALPTEADNLWSFLNMVREALSVDD